MSTLVYRVEALSPATVVTLMGTLDRPGVQGVERTLRDCLADMPAVLLLDVATLSVASCSHLGWLKELMAEAAIWPSVPVYLCGGEGVLPQCALPGYASLAAAKLVWAQASAPVRESLVLPPEPSSCGRARAFVGRVCAGWGLRRPARLAELLVSELVANAVVHAHTGLTVTVRRFGKGLELSVRDDGAGRVPGTLPADPRGFGLQLVDAMSDDWGSAVTGSGKVVWTRLAA